MTPGPIDRTSGTPGSDKNSDRSLPKFACYSWVLNIIMEFNPHTMFGNVQVYLFTPIFSFVSSAVQLSSVQLKIVNRSRLHRVPCWLKHWLQNYSKGQKVKWQDKFHFWSIQLSGGRYVPWCSLTSQLPIEASESSKLLVTLIPTDPQGSAGVAS